MERGPLIQTENRDYFVQVDIVSCDQNDDRTLECHVNTGEVDGEFNEMRYDNVKGLFFEGFAESEDGLLTGEYDPFGEYSRGRGLEFALDNKDTGCEVQKADSGEVLIQCKSSEAVIRAHQHHEFGERTGEVDSETMREYGLQ